ncbi:alpha/beta hydrolase [Ideonella sp. BN130291]|uniref:alpha/beta hydrolase n=1 Tax=Ideonella sp. BN130291 TaxID=3112940 RepID=UPI002E26338C|nr:alpha/beta hydrolase-fold protein [Ideonella sp. BN130291]
MTRFFTALLLLACAACSQAPVQRPPSAQPNVTVLAQPLAMPGLARERTLRLYLPPSYGQGERRYPVIYMHDGQNLFDDATSYVGEWGVDETLNALARSHGFEAIVVGVDHGGDKRMTELNPWANPRFGAGEGDAYLGFLVDVVKPFIDSHYRTLPGRDTTAIFGSSMGGLISDVAIHRYPQVFGKAGVFSPAYWTAPDVWAYAERQRLPAGARVYLYMGGQEGRGMVDEVRRMHQLLGSTLPAGAEATLHVEPAAEHNETAWRREFGPALVWLFGLQPQAAASR